MEISKLIGPDRIVFDLEIESKDGLLKEVSKRAARIVGLPADKLLDLLAAREELGSTGIGHGVAIPHASVQDLDMPFGLFVRLAHPVDFKSVDGKPVDIVFLLLTPASAPNQNIAGLAAISRKLRHPRISRRVRDSANAKEIYAELVRANSR